MEHFTVSWIWSDQAGEDCWSEPQAELLRPELGLGRAETSPTGRPTEDGRDGHVVSHVLSLGKLSCIVQMRTDLFNVILEITQGRN